MSRHDYGPVLLRHGGIAVLYLGAAALVALAGPVLFGLRGPEALALGAMVLVLGAVLHDAWLRERHETRIALQMRTLQAAQRQLSAELDRMRRGAGGLDDGEGDTNRVPARETAMLAEVEAALSRRDAKPSPVLSAASPGAEARRPAAARAGALSANRQEDDIAELLRTAVREERILLYEQPIVRLPSRRLVFLEYLARMRGSRGAIPAARFLNEARRVGLIGAVDKLVLLRVLQRLRDARGGARALEAFINVSAAALNDRGFLADLANYLEERRDVADRLILEVRADELSALDPDAAAARGRLARLGCRYSIDGFAEAGEVDTVAIFDLGASFVKLDAAGALLQPELSRRLVERLSVARVTLIAQRVETDEQATELAELEIGHGQGFLFGIPESLDSPAGGP